jgi:hemerythrin
MLKHHYPDTEAHKEEHRDLIQSARELQQELLQTNKPFEDEHLVFLEGWLTEHILATDQKLGRYLSQKS